MRIGKITSFVGVGLIGLIASGCQPEAGPLSAVSGRVAVKGVPLQGGLIVFVPDESKGQRGPIAFSKINSDGSYSLITKPPADGVQPAHARRAFGSGGGLVSRHGLRSRTQSISSKYSDPALSRIVCEVKANRPTRSTSIWSERRLRLSARKALRPRACQRQAASGIRASVPSRDTWPASAWAR